MAMVATSSTICSSRKCTCNCEKFSSEISAGVFVIASASSKEALSFSEKILLVLHSLTAAIFSSELPDFLLPAELESIQNGHMTIWAARMQTKWRSSAESVLLIEGA